MNSRQYSLRVFKIIVAALSITFFAVCAVWLQFRVEETYMKVEKIESKNRALGEEISRLEAEVESLMSFERIDRVVTDNNLGVKPPDRAFHINLKGKYQSIARAGESASGRNGSI